MAGALAATGPALAQSTWQEANKASAALQQEGKLDQALTMAWKAAELYEQNPNYKPTSHAQLLLNAMDMAESISNEKELAAARQALTALKRHIGEEDALTIQFQQRLGQAHYGVGQFQDGASAYERVLYLTERNFGGESPQYLDALLEYASISKTTRELVQTRKLLDRASAITAKLPPAHPQRLRTDFQQAILTLEANRREEAETMFRAIVETGEAVADAQQRAALGPLLLHAYGKLVYIADKQGDAAKVDAWVEKTRAVPLESKEPFPLVRVAPDLGISGDIHLTGTAKAVFKISTADGRVKQIDIVEKSGNPQFADRVKAALKEWRYRPSAPAGAAGELVEIQQSFGYRFDNEGPELGTRLKRRV
ncbi:energy transducer TonB [Niveispirillum sp. BGYR6]|uniref:energy transducer TonB n=1 Tax=Niveispirillum sp. BGYR6 TaxID=2971249 RepID=UPI0022B9D012|nr:energy transducer TonB [Niveispirillum sp. BGYR6]MDG5496480.1 energy transducer TonB [Niveispirillum sp. BGYR6]